VNDEEIAATLTAAFGPDAAGGWTIQFPAPTDRLSLNDRHHWARRARATKLWRTAAWAAAVNGLGRRRAGHYLPPCMVLVTFSVTTNRHRDAHNQAPTVKACVDGLVDAGVWPTDDERWVTVLDPRFEHRADRQVVIQLIPRADGAR
jgi:crossover junction endodeoxyribonuclease RusA